MRLARCVATELATDAVSSEDPACHPMAREKDAKPARVEMETRCISTSGQGMLDRHQRPLQPLETIGGLDEDVGEIEAEPLADGIDLCDVGTGNANHV